MSTRLLKRQVRTLAGSSLTTSYQAVGAVVTIAAYKLTIVNATTTDVLIEDQTSNDAFYIPSATSLSIVEGMAGNPQQIEKQACVPAQTIYMAKLPSGMAGTGTLVITVEGY